MVNVMDYGQHSRP